MRTAPDQSDSFADLDAHDPFGIARRPRGAGREEWSADGVAPATSDLVEWSMSTGSARRR